MSFAAFGGLGGEDDLPSLVSQAVVTDVEPVAQMGQAGGQENHLRGSVLLLLFPLGFHVLLLHGSEALNVLPHSPHYVSGFTQAIFKAALSPFLCPPGHLLLWWNSVNGVGTRCKATYIAHCS